jgi:chaperonin GroES
MSAVGRKISTNDSRVLTLHRSDFYKNKTKGGIVLAKKLQPLGDRLVVKADPAEEKTRSGIVLPDTAKEKPAEGTVIAVGMGRVLDNGTKVPLEVKIGDKVIYSKYGGTEVKIDNEEYIILSEKEILAIRS